MIINWLIFYYNIMSSCYRLYPSFNALKRTIALIKDLDMQTDSDLRKLSSVVESCLLPVYYF